MGKPVVRVKNILGDDVYGRWHVQKIQVRKGGQRYAIIPNKETFRTKDEAAHYAHLRTRRFVERSDELNKSHAIRWTTVMKYIFAVALISVMTAVAVHWFRDLDASVESIEH